MKKQYIFLGLAVLLTLGGCKKDKEGVFVTFNATIERPMAKVHLDADIKPLWDANDSIHVNDGTGSVTPLTNAHRGSFTATINSNTDGPYYAVYPASMVAENADLSRSTLVTLPRVQPYRTTSGGVQLIDAPMAAYNNGATKNLEFKNLCGLMQIVVTNDKHWDMILDSVHVEASDKAIRSGLNIEYFTTAEPYIQAGDRGTSDGVNYNKNVVSLARPGDQSIGIFVKSKKLDPTSANATCTLYVYIPKIPTSASNKFTIRVFSHPVWDGSGDDEVHIVYSKTQSATNMGYIGRSELVKVPISLEGCGLDGTTFTSMKAFSVDADNKICFSRGHIQYDCFSGRKRFAPRQWSFLSTTRDGSMNYSSWIEHFCWATGANFSSHGTTSGAYNNGTNDLSGDADWGTHFNNYYNGGDNSIWRTPTAYDYKHIFFHNGPTNNTLIDGTLSGLTNTTRHQDTSSRFIWVALSDVPGLDGNLYGIVAFPDGVDGTTFPAEDGAIRLGITAINYTNQDGRKMYDNNTLSVSQFEYLEAKGCIFFPCIGTFLDNGSLNDGWKKDISGSQGPEGAYWTSRYHIWTVTYQSYAFKVKTGQYYTGCYVYPYSDVTCNYREPVRLVCDYGTAYKWDPDQM